ncbi:MAG TPA: ribonuclease HI family protein [Candidatus Goldiibacteriota bacterium]|nr:ribonuclease HI family protein [Candidatus Goldiibacteriota bacterium]
MSKYLGYADGASSGNPGDAGIGIVIKEDGKEVLRVSKYIGVATNNVAEYMAIIKLLEMTDDLEIDEIEIFSDSELAVKQINGEFKINDEKLKELNDKVHSFSKITKFTVTHVGREKNSDADKLAKEGSKRGGKLHNV